jgi:outer membrane lipoprotein-sorting protein
VHLLRRLPLSRLLLLCALIVVIGVSAAALASALGGGPKPSPKPLAQAVHDALAAEPVQGVSANITLTNHLLEGASLASGDGGGSGTVGQLAHSPLVKGGSGRLWISKDGHVRLELQDEKGDVEITYDGHTVTMYDAATNTVYRYTPKQDTASAATSVPKPASPDTSSSTDHEALSLAKVEEAITHLKSHADLSGATPTDVAGQPAYTVRISPNEGGSLLSGAELSFDAVHGVPLRTAIYSTASAAPVIELTATEVSYGPVDSSVVSFTPPANAKVEEVALPRSGAKSSSAPSSKTDGTKVTNRGHGVASVAVVESQVKPGEKSSSAGTTEGLPKVSINGVSASELRTELGTILSFERSGVQYVLAGSVTPAAIEALARGL